MKSINPNLSPKKGKREIKTNRVLSTLQALKKKNPQDLTPVEKAINNKLSIVNKLNLDFSENIINKNEYSQKMNTADTFMTKTIQLLYAQKFGVNTDIKVTLSRFSRNQKDQKMAISRNSIDSKFERFENTDDLLMKVRYLYM